MQHQSNFHFFLFTFSFWLKDNNYIVSTCMLCWCCVRSYPSFHTRVFLTMMIKPMNEIWWNFNMLKSWINWTKYQNLFKNMLVSGLTDIMVQIPLVWNLWYDPMHHFVYKYDTIQCTSRASTGQFIFNSYGKWKQFLLCNKIKLYIW